MTEAVPRRAIQRQRRTRITDTVLIVALLAFGFSAVFQLFWTVSAQADDLEGHVVPGRCAKRAKRAKKVVDESDDAHVKAP